MFKELLILKTYSDSKEWLRSILDMLSAHFGKDVEFVIHDLSLDYEHTIVDIRNGQITGRKIGDTGDILGLEVIRGTATLLKLNEGTLRMFFLQVKSGFWKKGYGWRN